jgi:carbonic anhydrase
MVAVPVGTNLHPTMPTKLIFRLISSHFITFFIIIQEEGCSNLKVTYDEAEYTMIQLHFHSPSEHSLQGKFYPAEMHMVHQSAAGNFLVLGIWLDVISLVPSVNSPFLKHFWDAGVEATPQDVEDIEPLNPCQ